MALPFRSFARQLAGLTTLAALAAPAAHAQAPAWTGGTQTTNATPTDDTGVTAEGLALDAAGNQYVAGTLQHGAGSGRATVRTFGSLAVTSQSGGRSGGFVGRLSAAQQWQWVTQARSNTEGASFRRVAVSPAGDVYAVGTNFFDSFGGASSGTVTVGTLTYTAPITGDFATFFTRLNPTTGQPAWLFGTSQNVEVATLAWDAVAGNLVVAGRYQGTVTLGSSTLPVAAKYGVFVARVSAAGQWLSAVGVAATGSSSPTYGVTNVSAAVGPQGQVAVTGALSNGLSLAFGSSTLAAGGTGTKLFVAQLSAAGAWQWAASSTGTAASSGSAVAYTPAGALWVSGLAGSGTQLGTTAVEETFVGQLTATGTWRSAASATYVTPTGGLTSDAAGNALLVGEIGPLATAVYTFGSQSFTASGRRSYVARVSGSTGQWTAALPAPAIGAGTAASNAYYLVSPVLDAAGTLYTTGQFRGGPLVLGGASLTATLYNGSTTSTFGGDLLVARLGNAGLLGVRQVAGAAPLAVWPSPVAAGEAATFRLPAPARAATQLTVFDALGRPVRTASLAAGQQQATLGTAGLTPGLYLLQADGSRVQLLVE